MAEHPRAYPARSRYRGEVARQYLARRAKSRKWRLEERAVCRLLAELPPGRSILDAPIGTSRFHRHCRELGLSPIGADLSLAMLEQAARSMRGLTLCGDVAHLPLRDDSVDFVLSVRFLNWLPQAGLQATLSEYRRIARSGMILGIRTKERERIAHIAGFFRSVLSRPFDSLARLSAPLRRRLIQSEPSILIPPTDEVEALFDHLRLEVVSAEVVADGTEYTRRAFRFTPLRLFLLRLCEPRASAG